MEFVLYDENKHILLSKFSLPVCLPESLVTTLHCVQHPDQLELLRAELIEALRESS